MNERDEQVVALMRMFDAYGQVASPSRIDVYLEVIGTLPVAAVLEGVKDAMRESQDFPPGPGTVRRCILAVARMRPGDPDQNVLPMLNPPSLPELMSGVEKRVTRDYASVIARAAEIRVERKLPATLDARLWSLGEAESELGYRQEPYACRCNPPCGQGLERGLVQQRALAGRRLGVA